MRACVCVGGNIMSRRVAGYVSRLRGLKTLGLLSKLASQAGGPGCSLWAYLVAHANRRRGC